ncbi:hypothetical protein SAMN04488239_1348 [Ruegeria marina]|uniref:Transposase n=1 Tax=Ruegeria marina TaxID=639004 RepID=A0A1G7FFX4_9RHOB|nr:hypothetical protein SAMN04488239_1348 [Ruegeria marina]
MDKKSGTSKDAADKLVRGIKRKTRKHYSAEEKIRIVLAGLRGEESISALCRREGISIISPAMHEVVRPDMVAMLRPQPNARSVHCPAGHCGAMSR